jgi:predicted chitinase
MIDIDRATIAPLFRGSLSPGQAAGLEALLIAWGRDADSTDPRHIAYCLATVYHETGRMMRPVREGFAKDDAGARAGVLAAKRSYAVEDQTTGQVYYGRGLVQITWAGNYTKVGKAIGEDLYRNPDLALDPAIAARIAVVGMCAGLFSGKKLADYFNDATDDPIGARKIINGSDRADDIAGYHATFLSAIG